MYESHQSSGMGFLVAYKPMCEVAARGGRTISTHISTNNDRAIRIHVSLGFSFGQVTYVYVKHS
jgi:FR47-like protein